MALGLQHPWKLNNVDFIEEDGQKVLRIDIGFEKGAKFSHPDGEEPCPVHDTMERRWRHLNFFEHTCYIHCKVPRVTCSDGKVKQVDVPWARKGSGFTMLFEAYSMMLIERNCVLFDDFWTMKTPREASGFLAFWCDMTQESEIAPFMGFVKTVKKHWDGILNYITSKLTNGILEGINSKIQLIKRRARGYRNTTNFINMIYFTCGKLQFDYPLRST